MAEIALCQCRKFGYLYTNFRQGGPKNILSKLYVQRKKILNIIQDKFCSQLYLMCNATQHFYAIKIILKARDVSANIRPSSAASGACKLL